MTDTDAPSALPFGFAEHAPLTREGLEHLLAEPALGPLLDLTPVALVIVDPAERVCVFNASAERYFGLRREAVLGRAFQDLERDALLDLEAFLAGCERGRAAGVVTARSGSGSFNASRRRAGSEEPGDHFMLYFLVPSYAASATTKPAARPRAPALVMDPETARLAAKAAIAVSRKTSVLLLGATGVGKTTLARQIHDGSTRAERAFVHVNCGSIPETLFESELFGYERGAFTGALAAGKRGTIEQATGGTLFLDEIGEIPLPCQAKLLRFLEDGSIQAVGGAQGRRVDCAVIAATNRDLRAMVAAGTFRRDLYYRVSTFTIELPALGGGLDLDRVIDDQLARLNAGRSPALKLTPACHAMLATHEYEGNIRELRNVLEYLSIVVHETADVADLPRHLRERSAAPVEKTGALRGRVREFERRIIEETLAHCGSKREAARRLGIDVATLIRKARGD
ncbi:MAG: sigma 54-interacting transcriptional regulator [Gammaproteobacteria bacterium]|nr:sigma 54-interacting transcriptional regulator [Gammaproteobacteria bacterium]